MEPILLEALSVAVQQQEASLSELKSLRAVSQKFRTLVDQELDRRLRVLAEDGPDLHSLDGFEYTNCFHDGSDLELSLSAGMTKGRGRRATMNKCLWWIDAKKRGWKDDEGEEYELDFDDRAAKAALRKDGKIENVFEYVSDDKYDGSSHVWSVESQREEEVTYNAFQKLESLLECGSGFAYPYGYDSFGVNEFKERFDSEGFSELKECLWPILCRAKSVKHSFFEGHFELLEEFIFDVEREEFYVFSTQSGVNFVLKSRHTMSYSGC